MESVVIRVLQTLSGRHVIQRQMKKIIINNEFAKGVAETNIGLI
jgi:hypothetical protein